jgi:hypothetical protein
LSIDALLEAGLRLSMYEFTFYLGRHGTRRTCASCKAESMNEPLEHHQDCKAMQDFLSRCKAAESGKVVN